MITISTEFKLTFANALLTLSREKPLSKITVTDIISRANTCRQTFYNYFRDKNDLIYWIFLRTLTGERHLVETAGYFAYLTKLYTEAQKYADFFMQACKIPGQNSLSEAIFQQTYHYYRNFILDLHGTAVLDERLEFALMFNAHGASSLYIRWAEAGMPGSAVEQARYALHCMPDCIKQYLPLSDEERNY